MKLSWNCGAVKVGSPNQAASDTPSRLTRKWVVTSPAPVGAVISPTTTSSTQDNRKPKISARKIAIRDQKPRKATAATMVKIITSIATPGSCGQYTPATTGARLNPISMTTAPLTTGGNTVRTARPPTRWMSTPTAARVRPATRMAPVTDAEVPPVARMATTCLLYTSDAADEEDSVD